MRKDVNAASPEVNLNVKLRCPYCKSVIGSEPKPVCPSCGKHIVIPDHLRKVRFIDRKKARNKRDRELKLEDARRRTLTAVPFGRNPGYLIGAAIIMIIVGTMLIKRTIEVYNPVQTQVQKVIKEEMTASRHVNTLRAALEAYNQDCIRYPTTQQGLTALYINLGVPDWDGPYINMTIPDPWGTEYQYTNNNEQIKIFSCGPDKLADTDDDILPTEYEVNRMLDERAAGRVAR